MWRQHLVNLLWQAWHLSVSSLGNTTLTVVFTAAIFLARQVVKTYRHRQGIKEFWTDHWGENIRDGFIATAYAWAILFSGNVVKAVYQDHQSLVLQNHVLTDQNKTITDENKILKQPQCWMDNHFEYPNPYVAGAKSATMVIIRCNYKLDTPVQVVLQFDRDFLNGGPLLLSGGGISNGSVKQGRKLIGQINYQPVVANALMFVTVYGNTAQPPHAVTFTVRTLK